VLTSIRHRTTITSTNIAKMCFERLTRLKCGHYESYKLDYKDCKTAGGRACAYYVQAVVRTDKHRSCRKCKALNMAALGFASPSLCKT
jgi:hypothetical protein